MTDDCTLHLGDCLDVMRTMPPGSVDAVVTDPPYGTQVDRDGYGRRQNYGQVGRKIQNDADADIFAAMLVEVPRILRANSWLAVFCSPKRHALTAMIMETAGFPVAGEVVWDKAAPGLGGGIRYQHETILLCKHGEPKGRSALFSVIRSMMSRVNRGDKHPHEKPVDLMRSLITYCTDSGDVVLDPFAGSGSTLIACVKTGRFGIGIEIDPRWVAVAEERLRRAATPLLAGLPAPLPFDDWEGK